MLIPFPASLLKRGWMAGYSSCKDYSLRMLMHILVEWMHFQREWFFTSCFKTGPMYAAVIQSIPQNNDPFGITIIICTHRRCRSIRWKGVRCGLFFYALSLRSVSTLQLPSMQRGTLCVHQTFHTGILPTGVKMHPLFHCRCTDPKCITIECVSIERKKSPRSNIVNAYVATTKAAASGVWNSELGNGAVMQSYGETVE